MRHSLKYEKPEVTLVLTYEEFEAIYEIMGDAIHSYELYEQLEDIFNEIEGSE